MNNKIKLSDYVASFLSKHTDYAFVGQGSSVIHILDSIDKRKDIFNVSAQNEQGASLAADAYSRVTGHLGVSIATSGPGILNLLQGMGCSYFDSIPSLFISGAVPTNDYIAYSLQQRGTKIININPDLSTNRIAETDYFLPLKSREAFLALDDYLDKIN